MKIPLYGCLFKEKLNKKSFAGGGGHGGGGGGHGGGGGGGHGGEISILFNNLFGEN